MLLFKTYDNFFDTLLTFAYLLKTYCYICFSHIISVYLFLLQAILYIYLLLLLLIHLLYFFNNHLLHFKALLCFFDNKLFHLFLYNEKKL